MTSAISCLVRQALRMGGFQVDGFRYPQPCPIARRQNRARLDMGHAFEKVQHFLPAENDR
jgi:hypothetical protein